MTRLRLSGQFIVDQLDSQTGLVRVRRETPNLITRAGRNLVARMLLDSTGYDTGLTYQAIGDGQSIVVGSNRELDQELVRRAVTLRQDTSGVVAAFVTYFPAADLVYPVGGLDYQSAPVVGLTGGGGSGAQVTASVASGSITGFTVDDGGSGYTSAPAVDLTGGGGRGAAATATISSGAVSAVTLASDVPLVVEELGIFGHSSASANSDSGVLFARALLSATLVAGEDLNVSYVLTVS